MKIIAVILISGSAYLLRLGNLDVQILPLPQQQQQQQQQYQIAKIYPILAVLTTILAQVVVPIPIAVN